MKTCRSLFMVAAAACVLALAVSACGAPSPWSIQTQEGEVSLLSVSAADPSHVWAVGGGPVYFFNGVSWETQVSRLEAEPTDVSALDANHAWAGGGDSKGLIWFFDGSTWTKQFESPDTTISSVAAADASHAWAVGTSESSATIYFFNGVSWSAQYTAPIHIQDICALDSGHAWAVAEDKSGVSAVYFFNGTEWAKQYDAPRHHVLLGVSAADTTHVWAVGSNEKPGVAPESNTGLVYSFDGKAWRLQQEVAEQLHKVAAVGAAGAWAAGGIGDNGPVYHFDEVDQAVRRARVAVRYHRVRRAPRLGRGRPGWDIRVRGHPALGPCHLLEEKHALWKNNSCASLSGRAPTPV
jgi:hypothetical protein